MSQPTVDHAGEVTNSDATYSAIAALVRADGCALIGWSDGSGSHHEVLFSFRPQSLGRSNLGLHGPDCLFVSILRVGAFGFKVPAPPRHAVYIAEKLFGEDHPDETSTALTELLNGVAAALAVSEAT